MSPSRWQPSKYHVIIPSSAPRTSIYQSVHSKGGAFSADPGFIYSFFTSPWFTCCGQRKNFWCDVYEIAVCMYLNSFQTIGSSHLCSELSYEMPFKGILQEKESWDDTASSYDQPATAQFKWLTYMLQRLMRTTSTNNRFIENFQKCVTLLVIAKDVLFWDHVATSRTNIPDDLWRLEIG